MDDTKPNGRMRRLAIWLYMSSGVGLAASLTWWAMIDQARQVSDMPVARMNAPLDLGRIRMTPLELRITDDTPSLMLRAVVENLTGETQDMPFGFPPRFPAAQRGDAPLPDPAIILSRDEAPLRQLHPRMPEEIRIVWALPGPSRDPVSVTFFRQDFKLRDSIYGRATWLGHTAVARLNMAGAAE